AVVPAVVVVEVEGQHAGVIGGVQGVQGAALDLGLDAAAAEGAGLAAVIEDEHGGAGLLRRRAARLHDGAVDARPAALQGGVQLGQQFAHRFALVVRRRLAAAPALPPSAVNSPTHSSRKQVR